MTWNLCIFPLNKLKEHKFIHDCILFLTVLNSQLLQLNWKIFSMREKNVRNLASNKVRQIGRMKVKNMWRVLSAIYLFVYHTCSSTFHIPFLSFPISPPYPYSGASYVNVCKLSWFCHSTSTMPLLTIHVLAVFLSCYWWYFSHKSFAPNEHECDNKVKTRRIYSQMETIACCATLQERWFTARQCCWMGCMCAFFYGLDFFFLSLGNFKV